MQMTMATADFQRPRKSEGMTLAARAHIYQFIASVLTSHPTLETVQAVRDMARVLGIAGRDDWSLAEVDQDYSALFVVPSPRYAAPYESVYRDAWESRISPGQHASTGDNRSTLIKGLLMGDSTLEVKRCYSEAGVFPSGDIPDHIGNELRFMACLCVRRASAPDDGERFADLQARFRNDHLLKWLDLLGQRIRESERVGFYSLVLQVAALVLRSDT
jgi:TorA maturation chaperone TorD